MKTDKSELDLKLIHLFPDSAVNKSLVQMKQIARLPRYLSEYIIMRMIGDEPTVEKFRKMEAFISKYYPEKKDKEYVKSQLMEFGSVKLLDRIKVTADPRYDAYWCEIPVLDERKVPIDRHIVLEYETLLQKGTWGIITLEKRGLGQNAMVVSSFQPFQVTSYDATYFCDKREHFTTTEWLDVLINTIGFNPSLLSLEEKLLHLVRLVPLCEGNVNMIELGPKGTGKTYLYRNISSYSRVISGGLITPAALFYHAGIRQVGLLGLFDVVVFDEVSSARLRDSEDTINKLKDYMESGHFSRGRQEIASTTSIVLVGNIPISNSGLPISEIQFEILPNEMQDSAFLDRISAYLHGWKFRRIKDSATSLSKNYGFALDYFSEILHNLRKVSFYELVEHRLNLIDFDIRDEKAFRKNLSGLLKLLFPNQIIDEAFLPKLVELALSLRQNVINQIVRLDPEFNPKGLRVELIQQDDNFSEKYIKFNPKKVLLIS